MRVGTGRDTLMALWLLGCQQTSVANTDLSAEVDMAVSSGDLASPADLQTGPIADLSISPTGWLRRPTSTFGDQARAVAVDQAGNVLVSGTFDSSVDFGTGALNSASGKDVYLAKYASDGTALWAKRFGGLGDDDGLAVAVDAAGNVYLSGSFPGSIDFGGGTLNSAGGTDIFLAKFTPAGTHLFSRRFGGTGPDLPHSLAVDSTGRVIVSGAFSGTADFGGGNLTSAGMLDALLAAYASDGSYVFAKRFGGTGNDFGDYLAVDAAGNLLLSGRFSGTADLGGTPLVSQGSYDIFLAKYDASGTHLFSKGFGSAADDRGAGVAVDASGSIYQTGQFANSVDFGGGPLTAPTSADAFLVKYSPTGAHLWSKRFGSDRPDAGSGVAVDKDGNVILGGTFGGNVDFGGGPRTGGSVTPFLAKFAADGNHIWSEGYTGTGSGRIELVATDSNGFVITCGDFNGPIDFGSGALTSTSIDTFVLKRVP